MAQGAEAFARFLGDLCREVFVRKANAELNERFRPSVPPTRPVVTKYDLMGLEQVFTINDFGKCYRAFRGICDRAIIAPEFSDRVCRKYCELCRLAEAESATTSLAGALTNLFLPDPPDRFEAWAACITAANLLPRTKLGTHMFLPRVEGIPEDLRVAAIAYAMDMLESWNRTLTPGFFDWVAFALVSADLDSLPSEIVAKTQPIFQRAYGLGITTQEDPFARHRRLKQAGHSVEKSASAVQIRNSLIGMMPKRFFTPYRTC